MSQLGQQGARSNKTRNNNASVRVLEYLRKTPNQSVPYAEIQKATGLPDYAISNSVTHLVGKGLVKRPMKGVVILITARPEPPKDAPRPISITAPKSYQWVGVIEGNNHIAKDESGMLFVVIPLKDFMRGHTE